jgi:hypothetical protein
MKRVVATCAVTLSTVCLLVSAHLAAQPGRGGFGQRARQALSEPFVGLTAGGEVEQNLYSLHETGVSTAPVREAAEGFLATLADEQRERAMFPVDDSEWRNWANVHLFDRQGVSLDEMSGAQREAAYRLLRASLSAQGYETSRDIMRLNHHLAELVSDFDEYGEYLYWLSFMGEPNSAGPWGWQLDGHHLVINYFVIGDQIVMTPTFMGSEPVFAESGKYEGTSVMQAEQDLALELMQSLGPDQQRTAIVDGNKGRGANEAEMFRDNAVVPYDGLRADALDAPQRQRLLSLIETYVGNLREPHARLRMDEVAAHLDDTYFAWKGQVGPGAVFYYRIHSPVIYIEFDHQGPTALPGPRNAATRNHIHTVVRTPNGNDYGKDLLKLHYAAYRNDPSHGHVTAWN